MTAHTDPLQPVVDAWFPANASEFRAIHQTPCPVAPLESVGRARAAGLACMTDAEVETLSDALRAAHLRRPSEVDRLWQLVIIRGMA